MKISDFYPTQTTQFSIQYTDLVQNLTYTDPETMAEPYYMGYIPWEKVPSQQKVSQVTARKTGTEDYLKFEDVTVPENIPWFLTTHGTSDITPPGTSTYYVDEATGKFAQGRYASGYFGFLNSASMFRFNRYDRAVLHYLVTRVTPGDTPTYSTSAKSYTFDYDQKEFLDFLYNDAQIDIELWTESETTSSISVAINNFSDYGFSYSDGTYTYLIYPNTLAIPSTGRDSTTSGGAGWYSRVNTGVFMHANVDGTVKPYMTNIHATAWNGRYLVVNRSSYNYDSGSSIHPMYVYETNDIILGGFSGQIPGSFFRNAAVGQTAVFGNMVGRIYNQTNAYIYRCLTAADMKNLGGLLCTKLGANSAYGYTTSHYVQTYTDSNEPKQEFVSGILEDIQSVLQPWQYENITVNTFTADDIPEYVPPGPGPDDDDPTNYEDNPSTQLRVPLFAQIGGHKYLSSIREFRQVYQAVTKNVTDWQETYIMLTDGANTQWDLNKAEASFQAQIGLYRGLNANPIDCISSILAFPFDLRNYLAFNQEQLWRWGLLGYNGTDFSGGDGIYNEITGINGTTSGIVEGGTCTYFAEYKNFLDYEPYCSAEVYIPYCGSIAVDPKSYIGHTLRVRYIVDFNTGACTALLFRDNLVVDQISGQMGMQIPMTAQDIMNYNSALFRGAQNLKSAKTSATAQGISAATSAFGAIGGAITTGNPFTGAGSFTNSFSGYLNSITREGSAQYELATTQMPFKEISHATPGTATGNEQVCRLVIYRPTFLSGYSKDNYGDYGHTTGFACLENKQLRNFHGLTVASGLDTSGISGATEKEKEAIAGALKSGIYLP